MVDLALLQSVSYIAGALGVCVAAAYYVMTLKVQQTNMKATLETRQADILQRHAQITASQDFLDSWHDVVYNQNFLTFEEWQQKYGGARSPDHYTHFLAIIQYYDLLGGLLREGLVDIGLVENIQHPIHLILIWERVRPVIEGFRRYYKDDSFYRNIEYLYDRLVERHPESKLTLGVVNDQFARWNLQQEQI
jgi:hypothetical protein